MNTHSTLDTLGPILAKGAAEAVCVTGWGWLELPLTSQTSMGKLISQMWVILKPLTCA